MPHLLRASAVMVGLALLAPASAMAALSLQAVGDFASPTYVTSDPSDPNRLFIVEQDGRIKLRDGGSTKTFLDIDSIVRSPGDASPGGGNEEGLLSMALSPDYGTTGRFYVDYTNNDSNLVIAEFRASVDVTDPSTRREVLLIPHPGQANHNGGQLQFGPDGYLYASTGDGGGANDPDPPDAQSLDSQLGKILRIDPRESGGNPYTVPADNPFDEGTDCVDGCAEIWSYGLRNPWRFTFDRAIGAIAIGDVGQGAWEEVDYLAAPDAAKGLNFGWDCREGAHEAASADEAHCMEEPLVPFTYPVFEYQRVNGNCAVTGGYVVRDPSLGDLVGRYLYADFCVGALRSIDPTLPLAGSDDRSEGLSQPFITSFGEDACGRIYVVSRPGAVSRLVDGPTPPGCASPEPNPPAPASQPRDDSPPRLSLDGKKRRHIRRSRVVGVRVAVDETARVALDADVRPDRKDRFAFRDKTVELAAGVEERVKWRLSRREARKAKRRLRRGKKLSVRVKGRATDAAGNSSDREKLKIRLGR